MRYELRDTGYVLRVASYVLRVYQGTRDFDIYRADIEKIKGVYVEGNKFI